MTRAIGVARISGLACARFKVMANYKFTVRFDGRDFFGWQRHKEQPTVQGAIEDALTELQGHSCLIQGAGRTDRGAHAEGQTFSAELDAERELPATQEALNASFVAKGGAASIEILSIDPVADDFHARSAATGKIYRYEIWNTAQCPPELEGRVWHIPGPLDVKAMEAVCGCFVGEQDFASFATRPNFKQKSTRRDMRRVALTQDGPRITVLMEANGFLYKMVRNIVRAIVKVGEGRTTPEMIDDILDARDRKAAPGTAPASGLFLDAVQYD
ncbi:MAG: tRNA pseudouridine38-40 synthase [Hyphomicrobiaceae bacterium]|jgi:tRNA pseudouridine38-40 synthase